MKRENIILIARHFWVNAFRGKVVYPLMIIISLLLCFSAYSGWTYYEKQNEIRSHYQQKARESWESNPDKHPHRMAHFGTFAFRLKYPLSMFDSGIESFTGNAVFLEAHKQNSVNFSEASLSTGLLRFGELSMAMVLQTVFPLIIFFLGFSAVSADRENGTLKIILVQGAGWKEILIGKSLGLLALIVLCFIPVLLLMLYFLTGQEEVAATDVWIRFLCIGLIYGLFFMILSMATVSVSASSRKSKNALITLLGIWLFLVVLLPRSSQALGSYFYPSPSKVEFESLIEEETIQKGDSHNPDDPYFNSMKDSVLNAHQVSSVEDLPFNYGGFVMGIGEKNSSMIYREHLDELMRNYERQNSLSKMTALINPYMAVKNLSMALSGTDFASYVDFQHQAEKYRYELAQKMNELQMEHISPKKSEGSAGKSHVIGKENWSEIPDFQHHFFSFENALKNELLSLISLVLWCLTAVWGVTYLSHKAKSV